VGNSYTVNVHDLHFSFMGGNNAPALLGADFNEQNCFSPLRN
jgi:hypothetical protein